MSALQMNYGDANTIIDSYTAASAITLTAVTLTLSLFDGPTPINTLAASILTNGATVVTFSYFLDTTKLAGPGTYIGAFWGTFSGSPVPIKLASVRVDVKPATSGL